VDELIKAVGKLQGAVNQQKREIENTVHIYNTQINSFLQNAGYAYTVSIEETDEHSYKLLLKFGNGRGLVSGVRSHLSYGERNAFALVLFMYNAIYKHADFIVLDDPISSFDKNKKFAILDMLFIRGNSLRGKTALLLTHDFEPVIDTVYNHPSFFKGVPRAYFLENNDGEITETEICKADILSSVQVAKENVDNSPNVVSKIIFLRRYIEIVEGKNSAWHLLSNLIHRRNIPMINNVAMSEDDVESGTTKIQESIPGFSYDTAFAEIDNQANLLQLYDNATSNYEKLQIYRMIFPATAAEEHVMRKFLNGAYHIENDYLFQLNPLRFNTIPNYIVSECDKEVASLRAESNWD
jgi:ABC-type multidrug transport system ATPase subunit